MLDALIYSIQQVVIFLECKLISMNWLEKIRIHAMDPRNKDNVVFVVGAGTLIVVGHTHPRNQFEK